MSRKFCTERVPSFRNRGSPASINQILAFLSLYEGPPGLNKLRQLATLPNPSTLAQLPRLRKHTFAQTWFFATGSVPVELGSPSPVPGEQNFPDFSTVSEAWPWLWDQKISPIYSLSLQDPPYPHDWLCWNSTPAGHSLGPPLLSSAPEFERIAVPVVDPSTGLDHSLGTPCLHCLFSVSCSAHSHLAYGHSARSRPVTKSQKKLAVATFVSNKAFQAGLWPERRIQVLKEIPIHWSFNPERFSDSDCLIQICSLFFLGLFYMFSGTLQETQQPYTERNGFH